VTSRGLVGLWNFDDHTGNTYRDVSGNNHDAVATGTGLPTLTAGQVGQALAVADTGFDLEVQNSSDQFPVHIFSVECWVNFSSVAGLQKIFDFTYVKSGVRNGMNFGLFDGILKIVNPKADSSDWVAASSTTQFVADTWYHVVGTYDGTDLRLYVNGELEGTANNPGCEIRCGQNARIARMYRADSEYPLYLKGKVDEMKYYEYALPPDAVKRHYEGSR
jgi:hypothetical protein